MAFYSLSHRKNISTMTQTRTEEGTQLEEEEEGAVGTW